MRLRPIEQKHQADERIIKWLQIEAKDAERIVEFGCGVCTYTPHIPAKFLRTAVDSQRAYLEMCKDETIDLVHGSMLNWDRLDLGRFDTAVFIESIEHVAWRQAKRMIATLQSRRHVKRILVFAPMGHHPQSGHKATLHPEDFHSLGFLTRADENFHADRKTPRGAFYAVWENSTYSE